MIEHLAIYIAVVPIMIGDAYGDNLTARSGIEVNHTVETLFAGLIYAAMIVLWALSTSAEPSQVAAHSLVIVGLRWIIHDALFNLFRGRPFTYQGDGVNDALTDRILKSIPLHPALVKAGFLVICIGIAIILF